MIGLKIGIDIDNVISDMDEDLLKEYLIHDKELGGHGIVNPDARHVRRETFDWSKEEDDRFYYSNIERIAENFSVIDGAKETIDRLKADGHEIFIITGRDNGEYTDPLKLTVDWLAKNEIYYDRLILTNAYDNSQKTAECIKYGIEIMIDDSILTCLDIREHGIRALTMSTKHNLRDNTAVPERISGWDEAYRVITAAADK